MAARKTTPKKKPGKVAGRTNPNFRKQIDEFGNPTQAEPNFGKPKARKKAKKR